MTHKLPCRITSDPSYDYSDYFTHKGVYAPMPEQTKHATTDLEDVLEKMHTDLIALGYEKLADDLSEYIYEWAVQGEWGLTSEDLPSYFND